MYSGRLYEGVTVVVKTNTMATREAERRRGLCWSCDLEVGKARARTVRVSVCLRTDECLPFYVLYLSVYVNTLLIFLFCPVDYFYFLCPI